VSNFKYAVNTNGLKGLSYPDMAELISATGADGVEWGLPPDLGEAAKAAKQMDKLSKDHGLEVAAYINAGHLWKTDLMRQYSEILASVGGKMLRVAPPWLAYNLDESIHQKDSFMDLCKLTRQGLEKLVPLGKEYGIKYVIETHPGGLPASPVTARYLLEGLDPDCVAAIYDVANGVPEGFLRPRHGAEVLGPYLGYVHVKNVRPKREEDHTDFKVKRAHWCCELCPMDAGVVDYVEVFFALNIVAFSGWLCFEEFFKGSIPDDVDKAKTQIREALDFMKKCQAAAPTGLQKPYTTFND